MFSISVTGVDSIIKRLESYTKNLEEKNRIFMERLAQIGIDTASVMFKNAAYDGANGDVTVDRTPHWEGENTLVISASGEKILFIEFGTGVHYVEHPKGAEMGYIHGTYGLGLGANKNGWAYYGEMGSNPTPPARIVRTTDDGRAVIRTKGNPPARAMYEASKKMRYKMAEIAREVYGGG